MNTLLHDGFCQACELEEKNVKTQLNRDDFWECPECNLQLAVYGVQAVVLKFRGKNQYLSKTIYGSDEIDGAVLTRAKNDTVFSDKTIFNSAEEFDLYVKNDVEPRIDFTLQNLVNFYTEWKHGNPFTAENSKLVYKRLSRFFNIDFEKDNILNKLEKRDVAENMPYARSFKHLYSFLLRLFENYYTGNADWLPEMGMSLTQFELCKKHLPDSERHMLHDNPDLLKQRILCLILDVIGIVYSSKPPIVNPWFEFRNKIEDFIESKNFILKAEQQLIQKFNSQTSREEYKIHTDIFPSSFMGKVYTAPVVLLTTNPAYSKTEANKGFHNKYHEWLLGNLTHDFSNLPLPLFSLDEEYKNYSSYWYSKLKPLHLGKPDRIKAVAQNVCKIQFFPYTSEKFKRIPKQLIKEEFGQTFLPSQEYNFWLVRKAIERNAIIVLTRSSKVWFEAVPELENYKHLFFTVNKRNPSISAKNCPEGFPVIQSILNKLVPSI